jgi:cytochrome b subunit of formate dehydrogenase
MYKAGAPIGRVEKYLHTFHGKANFYDFEEAADCVDCHTSHFILPETDPKSSVHKDNLVATCSADECHPDANESFVLAGGHLLDRGDDADPVQKWTSFAFTWLTRSVIFLLILHMAAEFTRDLPIVLRERRERKKRNKGNRKKQRFAGLKKFLKKIFPFLPIGVAYADGGETAEAVLSNGAIVVTHDVGLRITRFNTAELLQHWVMLITFIVLMFTGLPLKFPDVIWAGPLYNLFGGIEIARIIHRAAGVIMVGDFIFHVFYVGIQYLRTKGKFKALLDPSKTTAPLPKDFVDVYHNILYILHIRKEPPRFGRFSYKEKFDYWAVFWGMFIMGGSGFILMFPVTVSTIMPGWLIPIAMIGHSDEAVLAILAIVIWHFYNVHFNPKKFPMNNVWLTGTLSEEEMEEEHPLEYKIKKDRGDYREERVMK